MLELKKYIINNLGVSPKSLIRKKTKIIKSDFIIAAINTEEIFFPDDCEMLRLVRGVINNEYECIIKILSIDLCVDIRNEADKIKSDFIKAFIGEHFC